MTKFEHFGSSEKNYNNHSPKNESFRNELFEDQYRADKNSNQSFQFRECELGMIQALPKFELIFNKFDYDKDDAISKEEAQRAASDSSLKPQEQQLAKLMNDHFEAIQPLYSRRITSLDLYSLSCETAWRSSSGL